MKHLAVPGAPPVSLMENPVNRLTSPSGFALTAHSSQRRLATELRPPAVRPPARRHGTSNRTRVARRIGRLGPDVTLGRFFLRSIHEQMFLDKTPPHERGEEAAG